MAVGITIDSKTYRPDREPVRKITPNVNIASFGDGYEHRVALGFNTLSNIIELEFSNRPIEDIEAIDNFLETTKGTTSFDYGFIKGKDKEETIKVRCSEWEITNIYNDIATLNCILIRVYE